MVLAIGEKAVDQERQIRTTGSNAAVEERFIAASNIATEKIQRTGNQRLRIHLAAGTKQNAVVIEQVHRAFGLDLPEDLTRHAAGINHAIEHNPVVVAAVGLVAAALGWVTGCSSITSPAVEFVTIVAAVT